MNHLGGSHSVVIPLTDVYLVSSVCRRTVTQMPVNCGSRARKCVRGGVLRELAAAEGRIKEEWAVGSATWRSLGTGKRGF